MTYLFRYLPDKNSQDDLHSLKDHGWRTYVPGLAYQHIVTTFVVPMRQRVVESPRWDVRAILGTHGFPPWSLEEFHDVIGSQYESMLKNGDPNPALKAVVYHTTVSSRNRRPGWYHVFEYNRHTIFDIPNLVEKAESQTELKKKPADYFWPGLCKIRVTVPLSSPTDGVSVGASGRDLDISIGHILIGKVFLTYYQSLLGTPKVILSPNDLKALHVKKISTIHSLSDLWPDFIQFSNFVKNCMKKTFKWQYHPFDGLKEEEQVVLQFKYEMCVSYQMEGISGVFNDNLKQQMNQAISTRMLTPILVVGRQGMNSQYVDFLLELRVFYDKEISEKCNERCSSQKVTSMLQKRLSKEGELLPECMDVSYDVTSLHDGEVSTSEESSDRPECMDVSKNVTSLHDGEVSTSEENGDRSTSEEINSLENTYMLL